MDGQIELRQHNIVLAYQREKQWQSHNDNDDDDDGGGGVDDDEDDDNEMMIMTCRLLSAPAKIKATSPKRGFKSQKTMHEKMMCPTNDWTFCTLIGCCCGTGLTSTTCRRGTQY